VTFGGIITAASAVSLDSQWTAGIINFNSTNSYTLTAGTGGNLTLENGPSAAIINVSTGSHFLNAPLFLNSNLLVTTAHAADSISFGGLVTGNHNLSVEGPGTLFLSGGVNIASETVGSPSSGSIDQIGGSNVPGNLFVASASNSYGVYSLGGGTLTSLGNEVVGASGTGTFIQTAGANNADTDLFLGLNALSSGKYVLQGGNLSIAQNEYIGESGLGSFLQTGGIHVVKGLLIIGGNYGAVGSYTLSGGELKLLSGSTINENGTLTITNTGTLDVTNTQLSMSFASPQSDPVKTIVGYLTSGYNGGAWTGTGIDSSTAAAGSSGRTLAVGYADGNTDFNTPAAPNQILVKYTLSGDANLDGLVNFNDLVAVIQNFNKAGTDWAHGNFLYGASTNFNDLVAVVQNFNKTLIPAGSSGESDGGSTIQLIGGTDVQLPEPSAIALAAIATAGALSRRRRKFISPPSSRRAPR
jgi:hypothetical protein